MLPDPCESISSQRLPSTGGARSDDYRHFVIAMRRLVALARGRSWNLNAIVKRSARTCDLLMHPRRHIGVVRALSDPAYAEIRKRQPQLAIKYLHPRHLVGNMSASERASAMVRHYGFLTARVDDRARSRILGDGLLLWAHDSAPGQHALSLRFSHPTDNEGELTIEYSFDGLVVYVLSFTFVPGQLFAIEADTVILISRIQGARSLFQETRNAMKLLHGLGAPGLLMASVQGIAEELGLSIVLGVPAARQVSNVVESYAFETVYDEYFDSLGATNAGGLFRLDMPLREKPLSEIKSSNRARTRHQRELKRSVAVSAARSLRTSSHVSGEAVFSQTSVRSRATRAALSLSDQRPSH